MSKKKTNTQAQVEKTKEELQAEEILHRAEEKERNKQNRRNEKAKENKDNEGPIGYIKDTQQELKAVTWPTKKELLQWCIIVLTTVGVISLFCVLIDNFVATPLMVYASGLEVGSDNFGPFDIALVVGLFASGLGSILGVMMHQGGETEGLSDTIASKLTGGSGQAQKNLDRITVFCIIVFVLCLIAMMLVFPTGTIKTS